MKKLSLFLIGLFLVPTLFLTSCDKGDDPGSGETATPAFTLMKDYMLANNLDINTILTNTDGAKFVAGAPAEADLQAFLDRYYIIDIRGAADYATSRIEGAINVSFANILNAAPLAEGQPILVVCYSGQTACFATSLLRMAGYSSTQALKWGMSGWNADTAASWNNNIGDAAQGNANWSYTATAAPTVYNDPTITSFSTSGEDILMERIEYVIADTFGSATASGGDVLASPSNYYINNYFSEADYTAFGHIDGAFRIKEDLLLATNGYKALDPATDGQVVTYCYTGQTSAVMTAWLRVLGYDAYTMTFGMNGIYNSNPAWTTNQWSPAVSKNLPLVN